MTRKIFQETTPVRICTALTCEVGYMLLQGAVCTLLVAKGQLEMTVRSPSPFALHSATVVKVMHTATAGRGVVQ